MLLYPEWALITLSGCFNTISWTLILRFDFNQFSASPVNLSAPPKPRLGFYLFWLWSCIYKLCLFTLEANNLLTKWLFAVTPLVSSCRSSLNEIAATPDLTINYPINGISIDTGSPFLTLSERNLNTYSQPFLQLSLF